MLVLAFKCDFCGRLYHRVQDVATLPEMFGENGELLVPHPNIRDGHVCSAQCRQGIEFGL